MQILGLLGIVFDAEVVFVTKSLLFFRLTLTILCTIISMSKIMNFQKLGIKSLYFESRIEPYMYLHIWGKFASVKNILYPSQLNLSLI